MQVRGVGSIANLAHEKGLYVIISSDAHIYTQVGVVDKAIELATSVGIKEEQVLNISVQKALDYLAARRARR